MNKNPGSYGPYYKAYRHSYFTGTLVVQQNTMHTNCPNCNRNISIQGPIETSELRVELCAALASHLALNCGGEQ